ncbi:hypothetical protein F7725_021954 [Dissostichus mawsoni]|uniref:Uncharacterized protein n=1 Tax=Dissostichus mawsoni TaxID=36200 RepID=A0A7J5ZCK9_DISMA|nr:hypothetical protein F7725_021954 [Dissostichus mawsoni]
MEIQRIRKTTLKQKKVTDFEMTPFTDQRISQQFFVPGFGDGYKKHYHEMTELFVICSAVGWVCFITTRRCEKRMRRKMSRRGGGEGDIELMRNAGDALDFSDTDQESSNENETVVKEVEQHVPGQDTVSDGADNNLNTFIEKESVAEDAKQTRQHHEEDTDDDDYDVIIDPNYNPSSDESSVPENEDSLAATSEQHGPQRMSMKTIRLS